MVNVAYLAVLTPAEIISADAVAVVRLAILKIPRSNETYLIIIKEWAKIVLGGAAFLIPLGVVMSVFGTANGSVFTAGRYITTNVIKYTEKELKLIIFFLISALEEFLTLPPERAIC